MVFPTPTLLFNKRGKQEEGSLLVKLIYSITHLHIIESLELPQWPFELKH